jgi:hypothetical protein
MKKIAEYKKLLLEDFTILGQEGYGTAYEAAKANDDTSSLAKIILHYAEWATITETKLSNLGSCHAAIETAPLPMLTFYAPEMAYFTPHRQMFQPPQAV